MVVNGFWKTKKMLKWVYVHKVCFLLVEEYRFISRYNYLNYLLVGIDLQAKNGQLEVACTILTPYLSFVFVYVYMF
ncbi:hypothetical protein DC20_07955 [Rufibacter tibetensis]|uniref:Uncharacterized protein n=1 Tax=Rufibacter tibetensis TaxID=512763 RepID=A0A0P0C2M5_9BACT|nr:hypothetical protein DC20_07955 [Rufibacter tibetensis]